MTENKKYMIKCFIILGIFSAVNLIWQGLELLYHGAVIPSGEDAIMGIVLAVSLYYNLRITVKEKVLIEQGCEFCQDSDCLESYLEMGDCYCRHCGRKLDGGGEDDNRIPL